MNDSRNSWRAHCMHVLLASAAVSACAGNGEGLDVNGRPPGDGSGSPPGGASDFTQIQDTIFTPIWEMRDE